MKYPLPSIIPMLCAAAFVPVAPAQQVQDFLLPDVNASSLRRAVTSASLSPRNYLHCVTAWYFAHET